MLGLSHGQDKAEETAMQRQFSVMRGGVRVVFGSGASRRILSEIEELQVSRAVIVATPRHANEASEILAGLGGRGIAVLATAREHVPVAIVSEAQREIERYEADAVLAFGGGSAIGLAKALALVAPVLVVAVPTTYSGSEMTPIYGMTEGGAKKTGRDERVRPKLVVYDPDLTLGLPPAVTTASLFNAMAHAIEALWHPGIDRGSAALAEEALRLLAASTLRLASHPDDKEALDAALEGAYLAGAVFGDVGSGLHHKLCHVLGGMFDLPHAATHAALLPHVVAFQRSRAPEAMSAIARALGVVDPARGIAELSRATNAPSGLESLGMPRDGIRAGPPSGRIPGFRLPRTRCHARGRNEPTRISLG